MTIWVNLKPKPDLVILIRLELREEQAEGGKCVMCGDDCWLAQHRLFVIAGKSVSGTDAIICQSCRDTLR